MSDRAGKAARVAVEAAGGCRKIIQRDHPTFYSDYKKARKVVDTDGGSAEPPTPPTPPPGP